MWWARMSRLPILICGNCQRHENYQGSKSCQRDDGTWYFALGYVLILSKQEHLHSPCGTEHHSVDCISDLSQCGGFPGWPTCGSFLRADLPPTAPPPPPQPTRWPPHHRLHLRAADAMLALFAQQRTTEHFSRTTFHPRPVCGSQLCGRNFMLPSPHSFECFAFLFPALVSSALIFLYFEMRVKKCRSFGVSSVFFFYGKMH